MARAYNQLVLRGGAHVQDRIHNAELCLFFSFAGVHLGEKVAGGADQIHTCAVLAEVNLADWSCSIGIELLAGLVPNPELVVVEAPTIEQMVEWIEPAAKGVQLG